MTVLARRVSSLPVRSALETWNLICDLVAPAGTAARSELDAISDAAAMLISEQHTAAAPIIISGAGPQVRVYTLHDEDAIAADDELLPIYADLSSDAWTMSLPARGEDVGLVRRLLASEGRISVRDIDDAEGATQSDSKRASVTIDLEGLSRL